MTPYEKKFKVPGRFEDHECTFITWPSKDSDLEIFNASSFDLAMPLSACLKLFSINRFLNLSRSSAKSIDLYCVPR